MLKKIIVEGHAQYEENIKKRIRVTNGPYTRLVNDFKQSVWRVLVTKVID